MAKARHSDHSTSVSLIRFLRVYRAYKFVVHCRCHSLVIHFGDATHWIPMLVYFGRYYNLALLDGDTVDITKRTFQGSQCRLLGLKIESQRAKRHQTLGSNKSVHP